LEALPILLDQAAGYDYEYTVNSEFFQAPQLTSVIDVTVRRQGFDPNSHNSLIASKREPNGSNADYLLDSFSNDLTALITQTQLPALLGINGTGLRFIKKWHDHCSAVKLFRQF
jgi:hypothetical protein